MRGSGRPLGSHAISFLESRGLDPEQAVTRFGLYTADIEDRRRDGGEWRCTPSERGRWLAFPFFDGGVEVNTKFRSKGQDGSKRFQQSPDGRKTFANVDVLDDSAVCRDGNPVVIVEGEIDLMTAAQCGYPYVVSVPSGAPAVGEGDDPSAARDADPDDDRQGYWEFFWNNRARLKKVRRFIIAVDNDRNGQRLEAELVRRLTAARCERVTYPEGCKDLNEVLMRHGEDAVKSVLANTYSLPTRGLYTINDYRDPGPIRTYSLGLGAGLDKLARLYRGSFSIVTGTPNSGKTRMVERWSVEMARLHGWHTTIITPEMPIRPHVYDDLSRMITGRASWEMTDEDKAEAHSFIEAHYSFIDADLAGLEDEDDDPTVEWVVERAEDAVYRFGTDLLIIDPWNELEHQRGRNETLPEYISRCIRALKRFARRHEVAVVVLAHPTKEGRDRGSELSLYDIDGGAMWINKADFGFVLHRPDPQATFTDLYVKKVRHHTTGEVGRVSYSFDKVRLAYHSIPNSAIDDER